MADQVNSILSESEGLRGLLISLLSLMDVDKTRPLTKHEYVQAAGPLGFDVTDEAWSSLCARFGNETTRTNGQENDDDTHLDATRPVEVMVPEKDLAQRTYEDRSGNVSAELGIQVSQVSGFDARDPRAGGLVVLGVDRRGRASGILQPGDVIYRVSGKSTPTLAALQAQLEDAGTVELEFFRNGKSRSARIQLR